MPPTRTKTCPAKWAPGAKTLTPGEMVGNVYEALKIPANSKRKKATQTASPFCIRLAKRTA